MKKYPTIRKYLPVICAFLLCFASGFSDTLDWYTGTGPAASPVVATGSNVILEDGTFNGGSGNVTIPSDAEIVIVSVGAYDYYLQDGHIFFDGHLNWDGNATAIDFTQLATAQAGGSAYDCLSVYYMTSADGNWPGTGTKTLYWDTDGDGAQTPDNGLNIIVRFYKNVDTASPIVASDVQEWAGSNNITGSVAGLGANDLGVGVVWADGASNLDGAPATYGQTEVEEHNYNASNMCIAEEQAEGAIRVESDSYNIYGGVFFGLKAK